MPVKASPIKRAHTSQLDIAYYDFGSKDGWPCILNHGFPYDVHSYTHCIEPLVNRGARVIVPYLRGFGSTKFLSADTPRSGEQAVLANDLLELMNALSIERAVLAGYDWGGRAACIVAALWPNRVTALVSGNSYNIQDIPSSMEPAPAAEEASYWYQYYFHSERGRAGLELNRRDITRLLWKLWSPSWQFSDLEFQTSSQAFDNADFVEVVIHSYRHRFGLVPGDAAVSHIELELEKQPLITVPSITIDGSVDGVAGNTANHAVKFSGPHEHRVFDNAGHNLPQERPKDWAKAIVDARTLGLG